MLLSLWPSLFDYSFFAPLLLRVVLGAILILSARTRTLGVGTSLTSSVLGGGIQIIGGVLLIVGLFTQPVAVVLGLYLLIEAIRAKKLSAESALIVVILLALLLLGPGAYALDLPL